MNQDFADKFSIGKLFDPFAFKSDYVGNGIGLSIVNMHKGSIGVVSNKDGTVFTILISNSY